MPAGAAGGSRKGADAAREPQQCLYFRPLPQGQGWLRPDFTVSTIAHSAVDAPGCSRSKGGRCRGRHSNSKARQQDHDEKHFDRFGQSEPNGARRRKGQLKARERQRTRPL
jgi:hypothetical protein